MTKLPKISLPSQTTITNEKVDQAGSMNFIDEAGLYDLRVTNPTFKVRDDGELDTYKNDPTWFKLLVALTTPEGKAIYIMVPIPTVKFTYGEKDSLMMLKQLRDFLSALGIRLDMSDTASVSQTIASIVENLPLLEGAPVKAHLQYSGYHTKSIGADKFVICQSNGEILKDSITKLPVEFGNRDAAKSHIEVKLKSKVSYLEVKEYVIPEVPVISLGIIHEATGTDDSLDFE